MKLRVNLIRHPSNATDLEKELVVEVGSLHAQGIKANAYLEKYREARARGAVPTDNEISISSKLGAMFEETREFVKQKAPGYEVDVSWSPDPDDFDSE